MKNYLTLGRWRMSVRVLVIGLVAIAVMIQLGRWQTHRAEAKLAIQSNLQNAEAGVALPIPAVNPDASALIWHRVVASGAWMPQDVLYLDNRPMGDRVGFYVLMPLRLASGSVLLVNRGWVPRDAVQRQRIPAYETSSGQVDVTGIAMPDEAHFLDLGGAAPKVGQIWENFSYDKFIAASGVTPLRLVLRQDNQSLDGLSREWPDRGAILQDQINRHYGYMFQWYAMAGAIVLLLIYYGLRQGKIGES